MSNLGGSYLSSPDQPSNVYPDRLIRPLPKRSIRSRLSQEAAESITFPPNPPSTSLPNYGHYTQNGEFISDAKVYSHQNGSVYDQDDVDDEDQCPHHHQHCDHDLDDDDVDSVEDSSPVAHRHLSSYRTSPRSPRSRHMRYGSYGSKTGSSAPDGYEAFENTNNKKKRKIPTSGSLNLHHSSLTNDLASMGISGTKDNANDEQGYYRSSSPSSGITQGPARARSNRKSASRNPLGISVNGSNARTGPLKYDQGVGFSTKTEDSKPDQGIISAAIANATALLRNPLGKGQENVGVLDQQAKAPPTNSQFTFTCESEAKGVKFPEQSLYSSDYSQRTTSAIPIPVAAANQKFSTQGTQTSPGIASQQNPQMAAPQQPVSGDIQGKKPRRRKGDVYALAARQRKLQQEYINLQHPPASDDIWICEFCEYESIFGAPPRALIRQYEIKDRRERKRLAEKQRLLEKAKLKGRKGKKQSRNATKATNHATQQPVNSQPYDQQPLEQMGDDYLDEGYGDDSVPLPTPPQSTTRQHAAMPGSYNVNANVGKAGGGSDRGPIR